MQNHNRKILVVEDEPALRRILTDEFRMDGYKVLAARDGVEGLAIASHEHPDVIVLDLLMPRMDGMTMLKNLRKEPWGRHASVVILTNIEGDAKRTIEAIGHGVYEFIVKTRWSLADLKERIREKIDAPNSTAWAPQH